MINPQNLHLPNSPAIRKVTASPKIPSLTLSSGLSSFHHRFAAFWASWRIRFNSLPLTCFNPFRSHIFTEAPLLSEFLKQNLQLCLKHFVKFPAKNQHRISSNLRRLIFNPWVKLRLLMKNVNGCIMQKALRIIWSVQICFP